MRDKLGYSVTDDTIQKITHSVGKKLYDEDTKNAQEAYNNVINIPYTHSKQEILYIMIDGAAINTRKLFENDSSSISRSEHLYESKIAMFFNSNNLQLRSDGITTDILQAFPPKERKMPNMFRL